MTRTAAALAAGMVAIAAVAGPGPAAEPEDGIVIERIWYRSERNRSFPKAFKGNGDLRIGSDGLEFRHKNKGWFLPWDRIRRISLGPMKGDVDTDWVVLSAPESDLGPLVGLRDGSRMGYGRRTEPLFRQIKDAARNARAAQFDVPDGFTTYEGLEHLLTLALPSDWSVEHRSAMVQDGKVHEGVVVFHEPVEASGTPAERVDRLQATIDRGEIRALRLERRQASKGMKEDGFSDAAVESLTADMLADRDQIGGLEMLAAPEAGSFPVDGHTGVRLRAVAADASGAAHHVDAVAVCDGRMLFLFRMRGPAENRGEDGDLLERVLASVRFSAAR